VLTEADVKVSVTLLADPWEPTLLNEPSLLVNEPSEATETEKVESEFPVSPYEAMLRVFPAQPCAVVSRLESVTPLNRKDPALDALTNNPENMEEIDRLSTKVYKIFIGIIKKIIIFIINGRAIYSIVFF
jgi:hypothetical protein